MHSCAVTFSYSLPMPVTSNGLLHVVGPYARTHLANLALVEIGLYNTVIVL